MADNGHLADGFYSGLRLSPADKRDTLVGVEQPRAYGPIDLRGLMPPPTDQQTSSSCTAHTATKLRYALTVKWHEAQGEGADPDETFSPLYEYWWTRIIDGDPGQDNGASMRGMCEALLKYQACLERDWPWDLDRLNTDPGGQPSPSFYPISGYARVGGGRGMDLNGSIQSVLAAGYPVALAISVYSNFFDLDDSGLSPLPKRGSRLLGYHAIPAAAWIPDGSPGGGRYWWDGSWGEGFGLSGWAAISAAFISRYCQEAWYVA